jgi:hypothetical protein
LNGQTEKVQWVALVSAIFVDGGDFAFTLIKKSSTMSGNTHGAPSTPPSLYRGERTDLLERAKANQYRLAQRLAYPCPNVERCGGMLQVMANDKVAYIQCSSFQDDCRNLAMLSKYTGKCLCGKNIKKVCKLS